MTTKAKESKADKDFAEKQMLRDLEEEAARSERRVRDVRAKLRTSKKPEEVPGKAYYVIKAPFYRLGVLYPAGTVVCVEDEAPSTTWRRVKPVRGAKLLPKAAPEVEPEEIEENEEIVPLEVGEEKPNPGGVAPSITNPATSAVVVPTTVADAANAKKAAEADTEVASKDRPHNKKL